MERFRHADLMDCQAVQWLPSILQAPVSPVFRMRALTALWPEAVGSTARALDLVEAGSMIACCWIVRMIWCWCIAYDHHAGR